MPNKTPKPTADFEIRLVHPDLRPWSVPTRVLGRVLDAVQRLVEQKESDDDDEVAVSGEITPVVAGDGHVLNLLDVKTGSARYPVSTKEGEFAKAVLKQTGVDIICPEKADWPPPTLSSLEDLSAVAKSLGCVIEFREPNTGNKLGNVLARISSSTFDDISANAYITGDSSVFGKIERVGGATKLHCGIRIPKHPRKMVICRVADSDLARELGRYLYNYVLVSGTAVWHKNSGRLKKMVISSFEPPKTGSIKQALTNIYNAGGSAWDEVDDPNSLIAEMRN